MRRTMRVVSAWPWLLGAVVVGGCGNPSTVERGPSQVHVSIVDRLASRHQEDVTILSTEVQDQRKELVADLRRFALGAFPDGYWVNCGPDSAYREIVISNEQEELRLRSWHPLYEADATLVAASYGLTPLNGVDRKAFLAEDDPAYVAKREAFDHIERQLLRAFLP